MLRADLRALLNLFRTSEGAKALASYAIVVACLSGGSMAIGSRTFLAPDLVSAVAGDESGGLALLYFAAALVLPVLGMLGLGPTQLGRELYSAPHVELLLTAPITSFAIIARGYLRSVAAWLVLCVAIGLPPVIGLADRTRLGQGAAFAFPLAAAVLVAPIVAAQVLVKVMLVRWCSGRRVRLLFGGVHVAVCIALSLLIALGFVAGDDAGGRVRDLMRSGVELPWLLAAPASLMAAAAGFEVPAGMLASNLALIAMPLPLLACSAGLYRRSFEAFGVSASPSRARPATGRRDWPATPVRSFLAKSRAESVRVRSNLAALAVVVVLMVVLLKSAAGAPNAMPKQLPELLRQGLSVLFAWHLLVFVVATLCFGAVVGDEQKQIALLATAPFPRRALLQAKLISLAGPFVLILAVALVGAPSIAGVRLGALAIVVLCALPILFFMLGAIVAIGTWPFAVRVHDEMPLSHNLRSVLPVLLISAFGGASMFAMWEARSLLAAAYEGRGWLAPLGGSRAALVLLGAEWWIGAVVLIAGLRIALANVERVLGPQ